jgi:hypothetical protein
MSIESETGRTSSVACLKTRISEGDGLNPIAFLTSSIMNLNVAKQKILIKMWKLKTLLKVKSTTSESQLNSGSSSPPKKNVYYADLK